MRLAQRAYRARKEGMLASERARSEKLSKALNDALRTIAGLHQPGLGSSQELNLSDLLTSLNDAAVHTTGIAPNANSAALVSSSPEAPCPSSQQQSLASSPSLVAAPDRVAQHGWATAGHDPCQSTTLALEATALLLQTRNPGRTPISQRFFHACLDRVIPLLSKSLGVESYYLALGLPLRLLGERVLRMQPLHSLVLRDTVADFQYNPGLTDHLPAMYRVVEGGGQAVPRLPPPSVQQLVRGKTRTTLMTDLSSHQGEWLEAVDVEEYLEERGIYVRGTSPDNAVSPGEKTPREYTGHTGYSQDGQALVKLTRPDASVQYRQGLAGEDPQPTLDRIVDNAYADALSRHEPADYSIFGLPRPPQWASIVDPGLPLGTGVVPVSSPNVRWSDSSSQSLPTPGQVSQIAIDLDKLVRLLASNATCIGPGPGIRKAAVDSAIRQSVVSG